MEIRLSILVLFLMFSISSNLASSICWINGITYNGDGRTTFALPNLKVEHRYILVEGVTYVN
ncbi:phage tail protein [Flavivirga eckloniae]|uniref:phage tail protein n=1 Tax=Flavivirga eckloniae TaxID=1803846 RepID=UPI0018F81234|nr:phage tail protein [Flavivirga eckloniae]